MNIVFINVSLRPDARVRRMPVGLAFIMTAVRRSGFDFDLINMDINSTTIEELGEILGSKEYDVYAFGCIVTGYKIVNNIADIIKAINPTSTIIAGNTVATSIPEILLDNTKVDIAVLGEGDVTIVELLKKLENGDNISSVQGIAYKENGKIVYTQERAVVPNIDTLGFPDWEIFDYEKYFEFERSDSATSAFDKISFPVNSARGCPFRCTFCCHAFKGKKYRRYSEDMIIEEIKRLNTRYNCNFVYFWDELSFSTRERALAMAEKIRDLDFRINWEAPTRGDLFRKEDVGIIKTLKDSGCSGISFSLENASPEILKAMNKKLNVSQFVEQVNALWERGVTPFTSVIFGYPQETPETIQRTLDVCEECNIFPSVGFLLPLPATPIYEWAKENGHIVNEMEYLERIGDRQDFHINLTTMSDEEFVETVTTKLEALAEKQGLKLESVFKTVMYQKPKYQRDV